MPPPSPHVPIEAIREAARRAVAEMSLRAVARSIPMSPMGLQHFVNGTRPYRSTLRKLNAWYVNRGASRGEFSEETAQAALAILLDGIPEGRAAGGRARRSAGAACPPARGRPHGSAGVAVAPARRSRA